MEFSPIQRFLNLYEDDRGSVHCVLDLIQENGVGTSADRIQRTYIVENHSRGQIRAWHGHKKGWTGLHVISGAVKCFAKNIKNEALVESAVCSARTPSIFWIPPGWYNGAMSLVDSTKILVYSTLTFYECELDDFRLPITEDEMNGIFRLENR